MLRPRTLLVLAALGAAGCADVADPLPPPAELVLVADSASGMLRIYPAADPDAATGVALGVPGAVPVAIASSGPVAAVALGAGDAVALVDLRAGLVARVLPMPTGSGPAGVAFLADSLLAVSLPGQGTVVRVDLVRGDTSTLVHATDPRGLVATRGRLFVLDANSAPCPGGPGRCALGDSRVIAADPEGVGLAPPLIDTIPLPGTIGASSAVIGPDALLYVLGSGDPDTPSGRLVVVDPVRRLELAAYGGLGNRPAALAMATERIIIVSATEGLMEFSTRERLLTRPAGAGVPLAGAAAVASDLAGRVWVARGPACGSGAGVLSLLGEGYVTLRELALGSCPSVAALALVPPPA